MTEKTELLEWLTLKWFCRTHPDLFPSVPSLRWFTITHKEELLKAGALGKSRGKVVVHQARLMKVLQDSITLEAA